MPGSTRGHRHILEAYSIVPWRPKDIAPSRFLIARAIKGGYANRAVASTMNVIHVSATTGKVRQLERTPPLDVDVIVLEQQRPNNSDIEARPYH